MNCVKADQLPELFEGVAAVMLENAELLCAMDAKLGDGDLGITMKKGFGALPDILRAQAETDIGKKLMMAGMKMTSVVPSTMGTLMASGLISGGKAISGEKQMDAVVFAAFIQGFAEGIVKRGKCDRGDRTVLDAIAPGADRAASLLSSDPGTSLKAAVNAALQGARAGTEATRAMIPKFGKAAVHRAAAKDVVDQGAYAGMLMIQGFDRYISQ